MREEHPEIKDKDFELYRGDEGFAVLFENHQLTRFEPDLQSLIRRLEFLVQFNLGFYRNRTPSLQKSEGFEVHHRYFSGGIWKNGKAVPGHEGAYDDGEKKYKIIGSYTLHF